MIPKLLSPAGSPAALTAAIEAGADEIYVGGPAFNARMHAANFTRETLAEAGEKCRVNGVRLHVALNTLLFDRELSEALEYVRFLAGEVKPDALIVQDLGLISAIRESFPELALHASTQMRIHSPKDIPFLKSLGLTRAVLARELPFSDIKRFCGNGIETEIFIHGALCVCESGGCLMSSVIGGRSGNRGECAQPCRLPCRGSMKYPLSLKDNCLAGHISELIGSGVTSLKIEGRMKSPDYVYAVTSVYRRLLDEKRDATPDELAALDRVFSRGGSTDGYFTGRIGKDMFGFRSEDDKRASRAENVKRVPYPPRVPDPAPAVPAFAPPARDESLCISPKEQRGLVLRFEGRLPSDAILEKYARSAARIDLPLRHAGDARFAKYADKISAILPRSVFCGEMSGFGSALDGLRSNGVRRLTVASAWQFSLASQGFFLHGDYTLNVTNRRSLAFYENCSLSSVMLSPETDGRFPKGSACALEYIVYGRTPLMYTRTCVIANLRGCPRERGGKTPDVCRGTLVDRTGAEFPVISAPNHTNTIYNSLPGYRLDRKKELKASGVGLYTLLFTTESDGEIENVIRLALEGGKPEFEFTRR